MNNAIKRNIVVILCDQLRADFLHAYGCSAVPTPNIDKLVQMGVVFDGAITQSTVCAPARASMMTGRFVSDHNVWTNDLPFREGMEYLPERMNEIGYSTGAFGKLHHYPAEDAKGFQHVIQMEEGRLKDKEPYLLWLKERHPEVTQMCNIKNKRFCFAEDEYYEHWITSCALDFINKQVKDEPAKPFFAWVSFQGPHPPIDPPQEVKGMVDASKLPLPIVSAEKELASVVKYRQVLDGFLGVSEDKIIEYRVLYAEIIVEIDHQIGRILDELESLGVLDNTTFIFSADHGDLLGDFNLNMKGPYPYNGQLAIPLIVSNHPEITFGTRSKSLAGNIDIPGTVLAIAGAERGIGVSRSLLDLAAPMPKQPREVIFSEFCDSIKTVDDGHYRFSYYPFTGERELYNRIDDPNELTNLAGAPENIHVETRMMGHIIDFMILAKGVRVEAHDLVPEQQEGIIKKHPEFLDEFQVAFPIMRKKQLEILAKAGLSTDYNEFCKSKEILAHYGVYWD